MHQHSLDLMAEFYRTYLRGRDKESLVIIDVGSQDVNGSYRELFAHPPWKYVGVDLAPGKNVDVVLQDAYDWREVASESVDVVVSGQTFEHTEFFWDTMREIARILKPNGLCCIIAPSSGPEHRYPQDCWRIYPDGFAAVARYAFLEVVEARTQWKDLPGYDDENNKWHDSLLIARKPETSLLTKLHRGFYHFLTRALRPAIAPAEALIQVFPTIDNTHCEEGSLLTRVSPGRWHEVSFLLPSILRGSLRIDFMTEPTFIDIEKVCIVGSDTTILYDASNAKNLNEIVLQGDAERINHSQFLRVKVTGIDPQLFLPALNTGTLNEPIRLQLRLFVHPCGKKA